MSQRFAVLSLPKETLEKGFHRALTCCLEDAIEVLWLNTGLRFVDLFKSEGCCLFIRNDLTQAF